MLLFLLHGETNVKRSVDGLSTYWVLTMYIWRRDSVPKHESKFALRNNLSGAIGTLEGTGLLSCTSTG